MEEEDKNIGILNHAFLRKKHTLREIEADKEEIELEEIPEIGYAERLERWARDMKLVADQAYKETKDPSIKEMDKDLNNIIKDMKWFENSVKFEEGLIEEAKGAIEI